MKLGKLPVKLFGEVLYNPEDDAGATPTWTFKANMTMLSRSKRVGHRCLRYRIHI